jgi:prophage maintenance system killer protein
VKKHPCIDGNKHTVFLSARVLLFLNGQACESTEVDEVIMIAGVIDGIVDEVTLTIWLARFSIKRTRCNLLM